METIHFLQGFASPALDAVAQGISDLGSERGYIVLMLAAYLGYDARIGRRAAIWLLVAYTLNFHLKELFGTARPFESRPELLRSTEVDLGPGFPSGHAQASTVFWGYLAVRIRRAWFWAVAILIVALISVTRIYLGVHVPMDVVGGILIGVAIVVAARAVDRAIAGAEVPAWSAFAAGLALPLAANVWLPPPGDDSGMLMGGLAAFLTAPMLWRHEPPVQLWRKVLLVVLGVVLALGLLTASSLALPEDVKRNPVGGFVRYLLLGYVGLIVTPWLGGVLRLQRTRALERA